MRDETLRRETIETRAAELAALGLELAGSCSTRRSPAPTATARPSPCSRGAPLERSSIPRVGVVARRDEPQAPRLGARASASGSTRRGCDRALRRPGDRGGRERQRRASGPSRSSAATWSSCSAATARCSRWRATTRGGRADPGRQPRPARLPDRDRRARTLPGAGRGPAPAASRSRSARCSTSSWSATGVRSAPFRALNDAVITKARARAHHRDRPSRSTAGSSPATAPTG